MKYIGLILLTGLLGCGKSTSKLNLNSENENKIIVQTENNSGSLTVKHETENNKEFEGVVLNPELSCKFDSVKTLYKNFFQEQSTFDTLMIFQKDDRDTLIQKSKVVFLESFDPNAAYYLFNADTIIGGNGYCSSDFYLLKDGKLSKVISQYADCVESASSTRKEICLDSTGIKLFYLNDLEDVWDDYKFKQGFEGSETEIFALFDSKHFQFGIQRKIIKCRSDMKLSDTMKFEIVRYDDFRYLLPDIKFGFEK